MKDYEDAGSWMWVAFAPSCRLIVDFIIGPRKQYIADRLLDVNSKASFKNSIPLFVTDGLKFYTEAILKKYGKLSRVPKNREERKTEET